MEDPQTATPIVYTPADRAALAPFIDPATEDADGDLLKWLRGQMGSPHEPALEFLLRLNQAIHDGFGYQARDMGAAQEPSQTVKVARGHLPRLRLADGGGAAPAGLRGAVRHRLHLLSRHMRAIRGAGATHAWCEVFLPDLGWTEFDPTNALAEAPT